jgi:SET domain-containing protein
MEKTELFEISRRNAEWLQKNYERLKKEYDKRWVLIQDGKVVKSASSFDEIMRTVRRHDPNKILVEYIQSEPVAMFF